MIEITLVDWLRLYAPAKAITTNIFAITLPNPLLYPSIKVTRLKSDIGQTFSGVTGEETANIQIDCWAKTTDEIKSIKAALISFFNTLSVSQANILSAGNLREQPSYEPKQHIFKQTLELTLSYKE